MSLQSRRHFSPGRPSMLGRASMLCRACLPALVLVAVLLPTAGCGDDRGSASPSPRPSSSATAADLRAHVSEQLERAMASLSAGSLAGWRAATPSASAPREHFDAVYEELAPLRLGGLTAHVDQVPGNGDVFDVRITGRTGSAGPPDRLVAELIVRAAPARQAWDQVTAVSPPSEAPTVPAPSEEATSPAPSEEATSPAPSEEATSPAPSEEATSPSPPARVGAVFVADETPPKVGQQYLMAFVHARRLDAAGCVAIYEGSWRLRSVHLARLVRSAGDRIRRLYGIRNRRTITLFVYASQNQALASLGIYPGQLDGRIKYYATTPDRFAVGPWPLGDVAVVAPALTGVEGWAPVMLQHEVTHAYTFGWFTGLAHRPDFFTEGLAVAAQSVQDYTPLKQAVASSSLRPPLVDGIAQGDIWGGRSSDEVHLSYQAAGATVGFVLRDWGRARLKSWIVAVSDSDLSATAIRQVTRRELGVRWAVFRSRWRAYVEALR